MGYIFIDSSKRINKENTNSNNIYISFNNNVVISKYIKLLNAIIPKTIYLINSSNNTFKISFNDGNIINVIIPINNYDVDTLGTTIKNLINYSTFDMVFDSNKYIYNMSSSQNFSITFTSNLYKLFGLQNTIYFSNNNQLKTNIINFNIPMIINIDIVNIESSFIGNNNLNSNFLLPFNVERFGIYSYYNNQYPQINYVSKEYKLNHMNIKLNDTDGDELNIENQDYFLLFEFE